MPCGSGVPKTPLTFAVLHEFLAASPSGRRRPQSAFMTITPSLAVTMLITFAKCPLSHPKGETVGRGGRNKTKSNLNARVSFDYHCTAV